MISDTSGVPLQVDLFSFPPCVVLNLLECDCHSHHGKADEVKEGLIHTLAENTFKKRQILEFSCLMYPVLSSVLLVPLAESCTGLFLHCRQWKRRN